MSIFKESFPTFVRKQMKIREAVLAHGNYGSDRMGSTNLSAISGKASDDVEIDPGAFYTLTTSKQCTIRMCSGVDVKWGTFPSYKNEPAGVKLAKRFILQGGVKGQTWRSEKDEDSGKTTTIMGDVARAGIGDNNLDPTITEHNQQVYGGGGAYGDLYTRSDATDGYGIVPMPGIIDADIRTKTAYGSLREARVRFVCHNRRQLDILELLYMRPGYPILLEWGWTPYISNKGKREESFPLIKSFFYKSSSYNSINKIIRSRRKSTSGNYDGFLGYCKNFNYKSRPDGGFDCVTEIIAMGEVLSGIKGERTYVNRWKKKNAQDEFTKLLLNPFQEKLFSKLFPTETWEDFEDDAQSYSNRDAAYLNNNSTVGAGNPKYRKLRKLYGRFFVDHWNKINTENSKQFIEDEDEKFSAFISWDLLAEMLNHFVLAKIKNKDGSQIVKITYLEPDSPDTKSRHKNKPTYMSYSKFKLSTVINMQGVDLNSVVDGSVDPSICILAHEFEPFIGKKNTNLKMEDYYPIVSGAPGYVEKPYQEYGSSGWNGICANEQIEDPKEATVYAPDNNRSIGKIFFNRQYILDTYKSMKFSEKGDNFDILKFLKKIWESPEGVNGACVNTHKFMVQQNSVGDSSEVRIIDLSFDSDYIVDKDVKGQPNFHELTPFGNRSILRDFNYSSNIPSALGATIAISAQAPESADSLDRVTFDYFNRKTTNRFSEKKSLDYSDEERKKYKNEYTDILSNLKSALSILSIYKAGNKNEIDDKDKIQNGMIPMSLYGRISSGYGKEIKGGKAGRYQRQRIIQYIQSLEGLLVSLQSRYHEDDEKNKKYKGYIHSKAKPPKKTSVIPLKFDAKLDGIGGITIGNVFKVNKSMLPMGYQDDNIAFIVMQESQKITSGQDWTTDINGQLILFNTKEEGIEVEGPEESLLNVELDSTDLLEKSLLGIALALVREIQEAGDTKQLYLGSATKDLGYGKGKVKMGNYKPAADKVKENYKQGDKTWSIVGGNYAGHGGFGKGFGNLVDKFRAGGFNLSNEGICAVIGNMIAESSLKPDALEKPDSYDCPRSGTNNYNTPDRDKLYYKKRTAALKKNGKVVRKANTDIKAIGGVGLWQWTGTRRDNFERYIGNFSVHTGPPINKYYIKDGTTSPTGGQVYKWRTLNAGIDGMYMDKNGGEGCGNYYRFTGFKSCQQSIGGGPGHLGNPTITGAWDEGCKEWFTAKENNLTYMKVLRGCATDPKSGKIHQSLGWQLEKYVDGITGKVIEPTCKQTKFTKHAARFAQFLYLTYENGGGISGLDQVGGPDMVKKLTTELWGKNLIPADYVCRPESEGGPDLTQGWTRPTQACFDNTGANATVKAKYSTDTLRMKAFNGSIEKRMKYALKTWNSIEAYGQKTRSVVRRGQDMTGFKTFGQQTLAPFPNDELLNGPDSDGTWNIEHYHHQSGVDHTGPR